MKKIIVAAIAALFGVAALAQSAFDEQGLSPEEVAQHRARMARKAQRTAENGGYVTLAPTGRVVRIVSAQRRAAKSALDESINVFTTTLRLPVEWGDADAAEKCPVKLAAAANADGRCGAAVVLIDDPAAPRLLVAPEEFWAAINVARLAEDNPSSEQLERRLKQEFWRATCMVLGAYASMQQPCLLTQISGNADLDHNVCLIPSIEVLPKTKNPAKLAAAANADGRCGAAVVLIDDPSAPRLLVAPEEFWAAVNVARLAEDNPSSEQLARRLKQEFWRATCMVLGAYASMQQPCLLTQISGNADLDRNICVIPSIEVLPKTKNAAKSRGIVPGKRAVYRKACEEGWAPAPTNDVQKAIWDKVHAMPTEPLKIKPETKKQDK